MKTLKNIGTAAAVLLLFTACGPKKPAIGEIWQKFKGNYCSEGYRLELHDDSTFFNMRVTPGSFGVRPFTEICRGKYNFVFDDKTGEWAIEFKKDMSFSAADCAGKVAIWNNKTGWMKGDTILTLPEWFDKQEVTKGKCEI